MFKPHVTVACLVQAQGKLLVVEERVAGRVTWNQPAGHLEADETLQEAALRELYEETGIHAELHYFLGVQQWIAPDNTPFVRFLFGVDLPAPCVISIAAGGWHLSKFLRPISYVRRWSRRACGCGNRACATRYSWWRRLTGRFTRVRIP